MDPSVYQHVFTLMRNLESVANDSAFHPSPDYGDPFTLTLKHPHNLIVVTTATYQKFPKLPHEAGRYDTLQKAVVALKERLRGDFGRELLSLNLLSGISIVVDEGTYVNNHLMLDALPENISIEIIGIKHVTLVYFGNPGLLCRISVEGRVNVTLKNIVILEVSSEPNKHLTTLIKLRESTRMDFVDVKISAQERVVIHASERGTSLKLIRSCIKNCMHGIVVTDGASALANQCCFEGIVGTSLAISHDATLIVSSSQIKNCSRFNLFVRCEVFLRDCHFSHSDVNQMSNSLKQDCLEIHSESNAIVESCSFEQKESVITIKKGSKLTMKKSTVKMGVAALRVFVSSHIIIEDCTFLDISTPPANPADVLEMAYNSEGSVKFKRNQMIDGSQARISTDIDPSKSNIDHDFDRNMRVEIKEFRPRPREGMLGIKKRFKETLREADRKGLPIYDTRVQRDGVKHCHGCGMSEQLPLILKLLDTTPRFDKFKYCDRCTTAYYCSQKCQKEDWRYHKFCCKKQD